MKSIQPHDDHCCLNFIPQNAFAQNIIQSFNDESTADLVFEVKRQSESRTTVVFYAHKQILQLSAKGSTLASLIHDCDKSTPVPIEGVDPQAFRQMLYYIYGGNIAGAEWKDLAKDLIDVADRYGIKNLKIEAEAWYEKHLKITVDNVVDTLLYADQKNCFLLKEAAMNFILKNARQVLVSESFEKICQEPSILREIREMDTTNNSHGITTRMAMLTKFSINELRAKLYDLGKDIDGPRKRLIEQLEAEEELEKKNKKLKPSSDSSDDSSESSSSGDDVIF